MPIEVAPFAYSPVLISLEKLGATSAGLRMAKMKAGPVVTDNGNFNIDAVFPESSYRDPAKVRHSRGTGALLGLRLRASPFYSSCATSSS